MMTRALFVCLVALLGFSGSSCTSSSEGTAAYGDRTTLNVTAAGDRDRLGFFTPASHQPRYKPSTTDAQAFAKHLEGHWGYVQGLGFTYPTGSSYYRAMGEGEMVIQRSPDNKLTVLGNISCEGIEKPEKGKPFKKWTSITFEGPAKVMTTNNFSADYNNRGSGSSGFIAVCKVRGMSGGIQNFYVDQSGKPVSQEYSEVELIIADDGALVVSPIGIFGGKGNPILEPAVETFFSLKVFRQ